MHANMGTDNSTAAEGNMTDRLGWGWGGGGGGIHSILLLRKDANMRTTEQLNFISVHP